ncbi:hypothetical protein KEM60_01285 [Austwickia sp. TVS 96-490-7B]|nr:hypothetical protein [Austwickia sp. TVS 96-490-7B]
MEGDKSLMRHLKFPNKYVITTAALAVALLAFSFPFPVIPKSEPSPTITINGKPEPNLYYRPESYSWLPDEQFQAFNIVRALFTRHFQVILGYQPSR